MFLAVGVEREREEAVVGDWGDWWALEFLGAATY